MPNALERKQIAPSEPDLQEAERLRDRVRRGDLQPPELRLKQQLEGIVRKWERLFGSDWGATSDATHKRNFRQDT